MCQASVEVARPSQDLQSSWGWGRQQTGKRLNCWAILTDIDKCYKENKIGLYNQPGRQFGNFLKSQIYACHMDI